MIALRVNAGSSPAWGSRFAIQYTPTVITLDEDGKEQHRIVGFLPPEEFVPELMLGNGKAYLQNNKIGRARVFFDRILREYPRSKSASAATELLRRIRS